MGWGTTTQTNLEGVPSGWPCLYRGTTVSRPYPRSEDEKGGTHIIKYVESGMRLQVLQSSDPMEG